MSWSYCKFSCPRLICMEVAKLAKKKIQKHGFRSFLNISCLLLESSSISCNWMCWSLRKNGVVQFQDQSDVYGSNCSHQFVVIVKHVVIKLCDQIKGYLIHFEKAMTILFKGKKRRCLRLSQVIGSFTVCSSN